MNQHPLSRTAGTAARLSRLLLVNLILLPFSPFASASTTPASPSVEGPEVVMASSKRDFGDVFAGEELEQNFPVQNAGNKPLELALKSALGTRSGSPGYPRPAVWNPTERIPARTVSARPAAPS